MFHPHFRGGMQKDFMVLEIGNSRHIILGETGCGTFQSCEDDESEVFMPKVVSIIWQKDDALRPRPLLSGMPSYRRWGPALVRGRVPVVVVPLKRDRPPDKRSRQYSPGHRRWRRGL